MAKQIYSVKEWEEHFRKYKWGETEVFDCMKGMGDNEDKLPTYRDLENVRVDVYCDTYDQGNDYYLTYKPFSKVPKTISTWHEYGYNSDGQEITIQLVASYRNTYENNVEYMVDKIYTQDAAGNRIQWVNEYKTQAGVGCTSNTVPVKGTDLLYIYLNEEEYSHYVYTQQGAQVLNYGGEPWIIELHEIEANRIPSVDENDEIDFLYRVDEVVYRDCLDEECPDDCPCDGAIYVGEDCVEYSCLCDDMTGFTDCDCDGMTGTTDCECDDMSGTTDCECDDMSGFTDEDGMSW